MLPTTEHSSIEGVKIIALIELVTELLLTEPIRVTGAQDRPTAPQGPDLCGEVAVTPLCDLGNMLPY